MSIGIYSVTNSVSGKKYIGQSIELEKRWGKHLAACRHGVKSKLYDAIRSYGADNFIFEVVEHCDVVDLNAREDHWISQYDSMKNGYNLISGGCNNRVLSDDTRRRMREAQIGKKHSIEHKAKIGAAQLGRVKSEAARQKLSAALKGRKHSEEHRRKNSEAKKLAGSGFLLQKYNINRVFSAATRAKLSAVKFGKPLQEEHKKHISEGRTMRYAIDRFLIAEGVV